MRRSLAIVWILAFLQGLAPTVAEGFDWPDWVSGLGNGDERVLVFLVGHRDRVAHVRASVDPDRIVVETPDAIALREGRIVAVDVDSVPGPFSQAGWMDREIEIMHLSRVEWWRGSRRDSKRKGGPRGTEADPARLARIRKLVEKDTLSAGEQLFLLKAMNDGVEF